MVVSIRKDPGPRVETDIRGPTDDSLKTCPRGSNTRPFRSTNCRPRGSPCGTSTPVTIEGVGRTPLKSWSGPGRTVLSQNSLPSSNSVDYSGSLDNEVTEDL